MSVQTRKTAVTFSELVKILEDGGSEAPVLEATELICHFEGVSRPMARFTRASSKELLSAIEKRLNGTPIQYIIGEWDFMGYTFSVSPACLIPREDTEVLCRYLTENCKRGGRFADLCTGSGCIAIAALLERPDLSAVCVELYPEAMDMAKKNATALGVSDRLEFILGDVCIPRDLASFDMIVSNPPYVTLEEMNGISREVQKEPRHALTDGGDGLSIIRKIIEIYPSMLKEGGSLAIEIGWKQGPAVCAIAESHGLCSRILKDSENRDRVVVIKRKETV